MTRHILHTAILAIGTVAMANVAYAGGSSEAIRGNNPEGVAQYVEQSENINTGFLVKLPGHFN